MYEEDKQKRKYIRNIDLKISSKYARKRQAKKERIPKKIMPEENKQKHREYMKECRKSPLKKVLKKLNENNKPKSVEVDTLINFIKDDVKSFSDAEVYTDGDDFEEDRVTGFP